MGSGQSFWPGVPQKGAKHLSEAGPYCEPFCSLTLGLHLKKENKTKQQADWWNEDESLIIIFPSVRRFAPKPQRENLQSKQSEEKWGTFSSPSLPSAFPGARALFCHALHICINAHYQPHIVISSLLLKCLVIAGSLLANAAQMDRWVQITAQCSRINWGRILKPASVAFHLHQGRKNLWTLISLIQI